MKGDLSSLYDFVLENTPNKDGPAYTQLTLIGDRLSDRPLSIRESQIGAANSVLDSPNRKRDKKKKAKKDKKEANAKSEDIQLSSQNAESKAEKKEKKRESKSVPESLPSNEASLLAKNHIHDLSDSSGLSD
jgi:CHASE2 domain-containing sensor protein